MNMKISEKEFAVIREISNNHLPDQRAIAARTGISLGLTNLIIKRLINKGYIKAKQLNRKKIQYILTPKGFGEKAQKSYFFTLRTISVLKTTKEKLQQLINEEKAKGATGFEIIGNNALADLAEIAFNNLALVKPFFSRTITENEDPNIAILLVRNGDNKTSIDLISYLAQTGIFIDQQLEPDRTGEEQ